MAVRERWLDAAKGAGILLAPFFLGTGGGIPGRLLARARHALSWRFAKHVSPILEVLTRRLAILFVHARWLTRRAGRPSELPAELIVSLTSYPPRFPTLALTLKCLLSQTIRADRTILWVAAKDVASLPSSVTDLKAHGLEIRLAKDTRSYKKIVPALIDFPRAYIVTADDDVYYSAAWLCALVAKAKEFLGERTIVCHRGHSMTYDETGQIKPYSEWDHAVRDDAQTLFPTGVGGILYSPNSLAAEAIEEDHFMTLCPHADDVWLFWMGLRAGSRYAKASSNWAPIAWDGTQASALHVSNVSANGNDAQIDNMARFYGSPRQIPSRHHHTEEQGAAQAQPGSLPASIRHLSADQIITKIQGGLAESMILTGDECRSLFDPVVTESTFGFSDPNGQR